MPFTHQHSWTLDAAPARVMAALTEPAHLVRWFAEHADVSLGSGGRYHFWGRHTLGTPTEGEARQRITAFEPGATLGFTWRVHGVDTAVTLALTAVGETTRLSLTHAVPGTLPVSRPRELIEDHWGLAIGNLVAHLAGGDGVILPDYADPAPEVRIVLHIAASPEAVFRALVEPALVNQWFGSTSSVIEARPGGRYDLGWKYTVHGREVSGGPTHVVEIVPNERLVLAWPDWRGDATVTGQTISFQLEAAGAGTTLTFRHAGFGRTADIGDYGFGWRGFLSTLEKVITEPGAALGPVSPSPT